MQRLASGMIALFAWSMAGCDELRARVHEFTRPDGGTDAGPAASIRAEPGPRPDAGASAATSSVAAIDDCKWGSCE